MRREFSAGAVIYYINSDIQNFEYLVLQYGTNHWDFPKGKLEPGETNEIAAFREVKEETALDISIDPGFEHKLFYRFRGRDGELVSKQVTFFSGRSATKDVKISEEHTGFRWLPYEEARRLLTYDNAVHLLDIAHAFITRHHTEF